MATEIIKTTPDCEIVSSRIFDVKRADLYCAWSDPTHLKNWWGPKGFTNTFNTFDFQVGGKWNFVMHAPEGGNFVNECEFIKIEDQSLIAWQRHSKPHFQVVATFEEISTDKTKLVFKMLFDTKEACDKIKKFAVDKNEENFDRLEVELTKITSKT